MRGIVSQSDDAPSLIFPVVPASGESAAQNSMGMERPVFESHIRNRREPQSGQEAVPSEGGSDDAELVDTGWAIQPLTFAPDTVQSSYRGSTHLVQHPQTYAQPDESMHDPDRRATSPDSRPKQTSRLQQHDHLVEDIKPLFPDTPPSYPPSYASSAGEMEEAHRFVGASQEPVQDHRSYLNDVTFASILSGAEESPSERQLDFRYRHSHKARKNSQNGSTLRLACGAAAVITVACIVIVLAQLVF